MIDFLNERVTMSYSLEGTGNVLYPTNCHDGFDLKVLLCLVKSPFGDSIDSGNDFSSWDLLYFLV
jgi:hypothetical protein